MLRIVLIFFFISANVVATPNIVVSIKPIHSIVSNITQGITTPKRVALVGSFLLYLVV
jgi:zinc transport system substrate-binding protein